MQPLEEYLDQQRQRVEVILDQLLPAPDSYPPLLMEAMRYSVFAGGKRLRPILTLAAADTVGGASDGVFPGRALATGQLLCGPCLWQFWHDWWPGDGRRIGREAGASGGARVHPSSQ